MAGNLDAAELQMPGKPGNGWPSRSQVKADVAVASTCRSDAIAKVAAQAACKVLGLERLERLTINHGRHSFINHALAGGRTLAEIRDPASHSSVLTASVYLHVAVDDDGQVGELFGLR